MSECSSFCDLSQCAKVQTQCSRIDFLNHFLNRCKNLLFNSKGTQHTVYCCCCQQAKLKVSIIRCKSLHPKKHVHRRVCVFCRTQVDFFNAHFWSILVMFDLWSDIEIVFRPHHIFPIQFFFLQKSIAIFKFKILHLFISND